MSNRCQPEAFAPVASYPPEDHDELSFELGADGIWRAFDGDGLIASAPTWRQVYERVGGRWN